MLRKLTYGLLGFFLTAAVASATAITQYPASFGNGVLDVTYLNQVISAVNNITGNGTPAAGTFTTLQGTTITSTTLNAANGGVQIDTGTKTATATSGAATLAKLSGVVTSEALSTAAGATYTLTVTDSKIAATQQVYASVSLGTATTGMPAVTTVTPAAGSLVVIVQNIHASAALNGTIKIAFTAFPN